MLSEFDDVLQDQPGETKAVKMSITDKEGEKIVSQAP